eukprot:NODE_566_length_5965_cov_0.720934.p1 type:complete len:550 gc:universal NODE_566_length_5965_cov_0.720934:1486-3135(+)
MIFTSIVQATCFGSNNVCVSGYISGNSAYITLDTLTSNGFGAFGFGSSMSTADIFTLENYKGTIVFHARSSTGQSTPRVVTDAAVSLISSSITSTRSTVTFSVPLTAQGSFVVGSKSGSNYIIWAYGKLNTNGGIMQHGSTGFGTGSLIMALTNSPPPTQAPTSTNSGSGPVLAPTTTTTSTPLTTESIYTPFNPICVDPNHNVCVSVQISEDLGFIVMDVSNKVGYGGIGFGPSMLDADLITSEIDNGKISVNARLASDYSTPGAVNDVNLNVTNTLLINGRRITYFTLPTKGENSFSHTISMNQKLVWSYGDIVNGKLQDHKSNYGTLNIDFTSAQQQGSSLALKLDLVPYHGILNTWTWLVLMPISMLIARFGKHTIGKKWFPIHKALNIITFLASTTGLILVCKAYNDDVFKTGFAHPFIGSLIYGCMILQMYLGYYIDKHWDPHRLKMPWTDYFHWFAGYGLSLLAFVNAVLAVQKNKECGYYVYPAVSLYSAYLAFMMFYAVWKYSLTHPMKMKVNAPKLPKFKKPQPSPATLSTDNPQIVSK